MTENERLARRHLEPFHQTIWSVFNGAWGLWLELPQKHRGIFSLDKRTHANVFWRLLVFEALNQFSDTTVQAKHAHNTVTFSIGNTVLFRFKKVTIEGLSRNYATQRSLDFNLQLSLPDLPEAIRLDIGYVLDATGSSVSEVRVIRRDGNEVAWQYPITGEVGGAEPIPEIRGPSDPTTPATRVRPLIIPKASGQDDE